MTCAWLHPVIIGELLFRCWQAVTRNHFIACPFLLLLLPRHCVSGFRPKKCTCTHNDAGISSMFLTCTCVKAGGQECTNLSTPLQNLPSKIYLFLPFSLGKALVQAESQRWTHETQREVAKREPSNRHTRCVCRVRQQQQNIEAHTH